MQIQCRSCHAQILADDISLDLALAKCRQCHAVFDFTDQVKMAAPPAKAKRDRGEVPMPSAFAVDESASGLTIVRRWARGPAWFFLFFSGFWNLIVSIFVVAAAGGGFKDESGGAADGCFIWLFLTPFILVGLGTGWAALALLLNRTRIEVRKGEISVKHGPVPWPGAKTLRTEELDQLYCTEYVAYTQNKVPQYRFALHALMKSGDRDKVAQGMETPEQGVFLEHLLEKHLGIEDRPVEGEHQS